MSDKIYDTSKPHAVKAIVYSCGRLLIVKSKKYWTFPGGKIESGETAKEALIRELFEEISVIPVSVKYLGQLRKEDYHTLVYWCRVPLFSMRIANEIEMISFATLEEVKSLDIYDYWKDVIDAICPEETNDTIVYKLMKVLK